MTLSLVGSVAASGEITLTVGAPGTLTPPSPPPVPPIPAVPPAAAATPFAASGSRAGFGAAAATSARTLREVSGAVLASAGNQDVRGDPDRRQAQEQRAHIGHVKHSLIAKGTSARRGARYPGAPTCRGSPLTAIRRGGRFAAETATAATRASAASPRALAPGWYSGESPAGSRSFRRCRRGSSRGSSPRAQLRSEPLAPRRAPWKRPAP